METSITYTGPASQAKLDEFCEKHSKGCYLFVSVIFQDVFIKKTDKLITGKHAPSDYQSGYWKNGKKCQWSSARKITAQNAGYTKD